MESPQTQTSQKPSSFSIRNIFRPDYERWEGVPPINIYLLRVLFLLMFLFLGKDSLTYILTFKGTWDPMNAMAWSIWASYALLSILGLIHPLKMIPIVLLEICYKVIWLIVVAYPLWTTNQLAGSSAEGMTYVFLPVVLPMLATPWKYTFKKYVLGSKKRN
ncbi:hypothetical protein [Chitinophaga nivalis]|uniref:DoxX family protein n=1 Tax=Chitinophaga nivalis TaxID=2991709 RepID=A0ABT3IJL9_9BACT|nr:hypothetical protein [Chitinophaga nivalis]MCW3466152.1 hypothetical protein [Chitinophaga nivalis]MCW3484157.1 hypothetical protein [Chitinophaga nivalis]